MQVTLRKTEVNDFEFLRKMLYEAVFWRRGENTPGFEQGLSYPEVKKALEGFGQRAKDIGVIAIADSVPAGAAWCRLWKEPDQMRGYMDDCVPVLAIAVAEGFRGKGIGAKLINELAALAAEQGIDKISLAVSKDNYALKLYIKQGFEEYRDMSDWLIMVKNI